MAEDFAIGRALVIPQSVMNNLNKIDEKINLIASDSEKMATHFTSAMTRMDGSTGNLIKKLQAIQGLVGSVGNLNIKGLDNASSSMSKTATEAERVANNVTQAATAINKMGSGMNIAELTARIKELNDQLTKGGGVQTVSEQQAIVNEKRSLEEELRLQKQSDNEKQKIREKSLEQELKRAERELSEIKRIEEERIKSAKREYNERAKLDSRFRKLNYQSYITSTEGSLRTADKANTYDQRAKAIKNLEEAIKKLRTTDANYQKDLQRLSDAHKRLSNEQKKVEANFKSIQSSQKRLMDTSGQLARQLALIFSVSQIEGYIMKLVKVRGEFELQNTALASILQNKDQADRLFAQITELAVQSPFTLKELTTYTKSLSAYSVEYEKLYDTTKMLADVSAGLGVDMQRLILAFGQVKAANFLRGTETRQFTEAGINMLGELAKYYSELEGRIVSVTEVQDRQFKRMISFQDVEQVFKRLTSAGGMFYNMQERQAETLAGMMSNLQDRIDLMLNSIGKENEGVIKGVIKILANLIENYEAVANAIEAIGVSFLAYKGYLLLTNKELIRFASLSGIATSSAAKQLTVGQLLQVGFLKLSKSIKSVSLAMKSFAASNIYLLAITAIATAIYEAVHWNDEYNEQLDNINKKHSETSANLNKIATEYESISKKARDAANAQEEFAYSGDTYKELYSQLSKLNEELKNRGYTLPIQLEFVNPENIDEAFKGGKELLDYANEFSTEFKKALATETNATEGWFGIFGDNLATDLKQLSDSYSEVGSAFKANLDIVENEVINISSKLTGAARDYYNELQKGKKEEESNTEWTLRRLELLQKINQATTYWGKNRRFNSILESNEILNDLYRQRVSISNKEKEVQYGLDKVLNSLIEKYGSLENLKKAVNDNPVIIKTEIDRVFEEMELGEQAKRFASFWASQRLKIPVEFTTPKELPTFYGDFRDTVKTIDTSGIFDKQLESMTSLVDLEEALQKKYQEVSKQQEVLNRANTERLDLTKQIAAEQEKLLSADADEANAARLKIENLENQRSVIDKTISDAKEANSEVIKIIKSIAEAFNLSYVSQKTTTKKDTQLQRLKDQIALIKKAGEEYKKLRQYYSKEEATSKIRESFKDAFSNLSLSTQMEFDVNGVIKALEALNYKVVEGGKEAVDEVVAPLKAQQDIDVSVKGLNEIQKQLDEVFAGYELSVELKEAGVDANLLGSILGINSFSLDDVKKQVEPLKELLIKSFGDSGEDLSKEIDSRISNYQKKEIQELIKSYSSVSAMFKQQRENIKAEYDKVLQYILAGKNETNAAQIDKIAEIITNNYKKAIGKINWEEFKTTSDYGLAFGNLDSVSTATLNRVYKSISKFKQEAISNQDASNVKEYVSAMERLFDKILERDNAFDNLNTMLKEYNLSLESLKDAESDYQKSLDAYESEYESSDETRKKQLIDDKAKAYENLSNATNRYYQSIDDLNKAETRAEQIFNDFGDSVSSLVSSSFGSDVASQFKSILDVFDSAKDALNLFSKSIQQTTANAAEKLLDTGSKSVESIGNVANGVSSAIGTTSKAAATSISAVEKASVILAVISAAIQVFNELSLVESENYEEHQEYLQGIIELQIEYNRSLMEAKLLHDDVFGSNPFGNIIEDIRTAQEAMQKYNEAANEMQVQWQDPEHGGFLGRIWKGLAKVIGSFDIFDLGWGDAIEGTVNDITNAVNGVNEGLVKAVDNLRYITQHGSKGFLGIGSKGTKTQDLREWVKQNLGADLFGEDGMVNLDIVNELLNSHAKNLTDDTKNTLEQLKTYAEIIEEVEENISDWATDVFRDLSSNLSSALVDSFRNGMSAADDFKTHVSSILETLGEQMIQNMLYNQVLSQYQGKLEELTKKYALGNMSEEEYMNSLAALVGNIMGGADAFIGVGEDFLEKLKEAAKKYGYDIFLPDENGDTMSSLQRGISSISEETAQALEALLNSMRFFVSDSNTVLHNIYNAITMPNVENPFLMELKVQSNYLNNLNALVSSVIKNSSGKGKVLRVEIA